MNKNQINQLKIKIEKSRARLITYAAEIGMLLMYVRFVAVPGMDRISTNGACIFFDPSFINKLKDEELDFVLSHELMHILCEDIYRPESYAFSNYHYACDLRINSMLMERGIFEESYSHLGKIQYKLPGIEKSVGEMEIPEILANLVFNLDSFDNSIKKKYIIDSDVYWGKLPFARGCTLILDRENSEYLSILSEDILSPNDEDKEVWQMRAAVAYTSTKKKSNGGDGDGSADGVTKLMERILGKLGKSTIDWRKILNDFIREEVCDYSFSPPDRRFSETDFFLPDFNEKELLTREILFMIDTSGSVDDEELALVYSEILGAIEEYSGALVGRLGFFDHEATKPVPMCSVEELLSTVPVGGGDTNFYSIFSVIEEEQPSCIIVFTDGCAKFPDEEYARGIPVLWVITESDITAPWGKTVRLTRK